MRTFAGRDIAIVVDRVGEPGSAGMTAAHGRIVGTPLRATFVGPSVQIEEIRRALSEPGEDRMVALVTDSQIIGRAN